MFFAPFQERKGAVRFGHALTGRLAISLPFLCVTVLLPVITGRKWLLLFALAALLHELGHLLALYLLGCRAAQICLRLSGGEIRYSGSLSYGKEALAALAGPMTNLLCALICALAARSCPSPGLYRFIGCHLTLAAFNLLPALPLDGGRVLSAALSARFPLWGETIAGRVSLLVGLALALAGLVLLGKGANPTLFAAGMVILRPWRAKKALHLSKNLIKYKFKL